MEEFQGLELDLLSLYTNLFQALELRQVRSFVYLKILQEILALFQQGLQQYLVKTPLV